MLSPQRRAQMDAVLSQSATRPKTALTPQRRAQMDAVLGNNQKSIGGFAKNVVTSGARLLGDTASAALNVFNPNMEKNTVANMARLTTGVAQLADPTRGNQIVSAIPGLGAVQRGAGNQEAQARAVGQFYKDRYGGIDNIANTFYNDPVGVVADAATVATGVGGALRGGGAVASKLGLVGKSNTLTKAGRIASNIGRTTDPILVAGRGTKMAGSKLFSRLKPTALARAEDMVTAGIGNPAKQARASQKAGRSVASFIDEYDLYDRSAETAGRVRGDILSRYDDLALRSGKSVNTGTLVKAFDDEIARLEAGVGGVVSDANQSKIAELTRRKNQLLQAGGGKVVDGQLVSSPISIGADTLTNFRRNVIDPDVPQSMFNLDARGSGTAQGAKQARNIIKAGIDSTDPQLAKLGLDYGMAKELEKILTSAEARGKNRQLFNFTKLGGAGVGGLVSGAPGVIFGFTVEQIVNNPAFIKYASKGLKQAMNAQLPRTPRGVGLAGNSLYQTGRAGRMLTSSQMQPKSTNTQTQRMPQSNQILENPYDNYTPKSDLLDNIARAQGLDVEKMRRKRLNFNRR